MMCPLPATRWLDHWRFPGLRATPGLFLRFLFLSLFCTVFLARTALGAPTPGSSGSVEPSSSPAPDARVVHVGFFAMNAYGVDQTSSSYNLDVYVWLRWRGDSDPSATLELANGINRAWGSRSALYEAPRELPTGERYQVLRIEGTFFKPFLLDRYPLDRHSLTLTLEDSVDSVDKHVYVIDREDSGYNSGLRIPGWTIRGWQAEDYVFNYGTQFGEKGANANANRYSRASFSIDIARPVGYYVWKLLMPLAVVLAVGLVALLLRADSLETRLAMLGTALLTMILNQAGYTATLPGVGNLVLLDWIYVLAYLVVLVNIVWVFRDGRRVGLAEEAEREVLVEKLYARDRRLLVAWIILLTVTIVGLSVWS